MNRIPVMAICLGLGLVMPALVQARPGIIGIIDAADSILVQRIAPRPMRGCESDLNDSLRFTICYPVLEEGVAQREGWREDLGDLLGGKTFLWNSDSCGYDPQAIVRFVMPENSPVMVVFTSKCDSSHVGLLMIRPVMAYVELASGGGDLLDVLAEALPDVPPDTNPFYAARQQRDEEEAYDAPPTPITRIEPEYPAMARGAQFQGIVVLNVLVGTEGRVKDVKVIHGVMGLTEAAIDAARQWIWNPARSHGKAVDAWVNLPMDFKTGSVNVPTNFPPFPFGGRREPQFTKPVTRPLDHPTR